MNEARKYYIQFAGLQVLIKTHRRNGGFYLNGWCGLNHTCHRPCLRFGDRATFLDLDRITGLDLVGLVMRVILVRAHDDLAIQRMFYVALDQNGNGLVHLVRNHFTDQRALERLFHWFVHLASFRFITVFTRAISRRTFLSCEVLLSCCVAICMRRPNCAFNRSFSSFCRAGWSLQRSSDAFIYNSNYWPTCRMTNVVASGSLAAARRNASRASASSTPSISYSTLPG